MWQGLVPKLMGERVLSLRRVTLVGAGDICAQGLAFVVTLLLAGLMAEADYGAFRTLLSIGMLLGVAVWVSPSNALVFFGSSVDGRPRRSAATSAALIQSAVALSVLAVPLVLLVEEGVFLFLFLFGMMLFNVVLALLRAGLLFRRYAIFQLVSGTGRVAAVVLIVLIFGQRDSVIALLIMAFAWIFALSTIPRPALAVLRIGHDRPTREAHRAVAAYAIPVTLSSGIVTAFANADLLFIAAFQGTIAAAIYGIARTFATAFAVTPAALGTVLFSEVSARRDAAQARARLRTGLWAMAGVALLLFSLMAIFMPWILARLLPPLYADAHIPILLLGVAATAFGAIVLWTSVLHGLGHQVRVLTLNAALLPIDLVAVALGALFWAQEGAAAGYAIAMTVGAALFSIVGGRILAKGDGREDGYAGLESSG